MPVPARSPWRPWSKEEIEAAIDLRSKGKRNIEIAFQLNQTFKTGRTEKAVEHQFSKMRDENSARLVRNRLGILVISPWPQRDDELRQVWLQDNPRLSTQEMADKMGLSKNSIIARAGRIGLPMRGSPIIRDGRENKSKRNAVVAKSTLREMASLPIVQHTEPTEPIKHVRSSAFNPSFVIDKPCAAPEPIPLTRTCQWIHGTLGGGRVWHFCGRACLGSWCAEHYAMVFLKNPVARSA